MKVKMEHSWKEALADEFNKEYFKKLSSFVREEYTHKNIYPPPRFVFHAFELCPFEKVKVVILGQDPYHGKGQAHGLSFSVPDDIPIPPSLKNIYKEIAHDVGGTIPQHGNLEHWAEQGVLLLNATLTVQAHTPGSHQHKGWEAFTDAIIKTISDKKEHVVFILWGRYARAKATLIDTNKHLVLESAHPSPFSATQFFGSKPFSKTNTYLIKHGKEPIVWTS